MSGEIDVGRLYILEYERIKEEQKTRITFRDSLLYATLAAIAAVIAATLNAHRHADLLLLLPPVCILLGWTYLVNDEKVSAIGRYIRDDLAPKLTALTPGNTPVLGWEHAHRNDPRRAARKALQLLVDLCMFTICPLAALIVYWVNGPYAAPFLLVSIAEALALAGLGIQITRYAELDRSQI